MQTEAQDRNQMTTEDGAPIHSAQFIEAGDPMPRRGNNMILNMGIGAFTAPPWPIDTSITLPQLLMASVVTLGTPTDNGRIVEMVTVPWFELIDYLTRNPSAMYQIPPRKLEEIVAGAWERSGAQVVLTPRSGDRGYDVLAEYTAFGKLTIVTSVKALGEGKCVTYNDIRSLIGVVDMRGASKGVLTTTGELPPRVHKDHDIMREVATRKLELIPGQQLLRCINDIASQRPR